MTVPAMTPALLPGFVDAMPEVPFGGTPIDTVLVPPEESAL